LPIEVRSGPLVLSAHLAVPPTRSLAAPAVVVCHGMPVAGVAAAKADASFPELADRIANELGWFALSFAYRGAGGSKGQFSLGGWLADTAAAVDHVAKVDGVSGVYLAGFGTGGALAICAAARDPRVRGVAALAAPADFDDWAAQPRRLLEHARDLGMVTDPAFPSSLELWGRDLKTIRAVQCVASVVPRPLLVVHGTDDESVPDFDARVVADAHGHAELRIIPGASHQLRHDPRAIAMLLGWLDRQRHAA
jgi:alpha/beta superfamily hydrolase